MYREKAANMYCTEAFALTSVGLRFSSIDLNKFGWGSLLFQNLKLHTSVRWSLRFLCPFYFSFCQFCYPPPSQWSTVTGLGRDPVHHPSNSALLAHHLLYDWIWSLCSSLFLVLLLHLVVLSLLHVSPCRLQAYVAMGCWVFALARVQRYFTLRGFVTHGEGTYGGWMYLFIRSTCEISPSQSHPQILWNDEPIIVSRRGACANCQHPIPQCLLSVWWLLRTISTVSGLVEMASWNCWRVKSLF